MSTGIFSIAAVFGSLEAIALQHDWLRIW